mmetsp:Transcript_25633/g.35422  ORF Transcript_25633/g.35422 Transcript_25633/m.35422 type:complete len:241 (+) Transcript_25633:265-987(+)|eukprot:CAMPEP_0196571756 /NCGR_PEP_ID=MMETSP1081-20130531/1885_1 /TAXON_ID=36882 /ORGANISM="Pyramimonas amylifera, Strain CCMP720" /LENGTH=240 /DNA_ID=CAMNT_0041888811 /DNA_START=245 /DNA_END=967 /DNA_ORIENTATION=-
MHGEKESGKEAVWDVLGRGSPAGRALHTLYSKDVGAKTKGNQASDINRARINRPEARKASPVDPAMWGKSGKERSEVKVAVPLVYGAAADVDRFENPGRPGLPYTCKKQAGEIKVEQRQLDLEIRSNPHPVPKGPLIDEKEKIRYARKLEFNGRPPEEMPEGTFQPPKPKKKPPTKLEELEKLFEDVTKEIEERNQFLADMEALGQRGKYEAKITSEIATRLHQLKVLDEKIVIVNKTSI